jgi:hypothetical protein
MMSAREGVLMAEAIVELDHAELLRPFLARRFRSRYNTIAPGSERRAELLNKLGHRYDEVLNWRYAHPAGSAELVKELRGLGAAALCYCLCASAELDGRQLVLAEALSALSGRGLPVLLVCRRGALAYFEPEYESGAGQRYILQRRSVEAGAATDHRDT